MEHLLQLQAYIAKAQAGIEDQWPLPAPNSMFNLSIRDLLATIFIGIALFAVLALKSSPLSKLALVATAVALEPAVIALPFNVLHAAVHRSPRFWDPLVVEPMLKHLIDHFGAIQREAAMILANGSTPGIVEFSKVNPFQRRIATNQPWTVFPFFSYGTFNEDNCAKAPITSSILRQIPTVKLAMYSVMTEGAEIPTHCGFFKGVLRVHLTLLTDQEDVPDARFIEVGGQRYSWKTGEMVAFDDTYPHRVSNRVKGRRVVLFLDVERPYGDAVSRAVAKAVTFAMRNSPNVTRIAAAQESRKA